MSSNSFDRAFGLLEQTKQFEQLKKWSLAKAATQEAINIFKFLKSLERDHGKRALLDENINHFEGKIQYFNILIESDRLFEVALTADESKSGSATVIGLYISAGEQILTIKNIFGVVLLNDRFFNFD